MKTRLLSALMVVCMLVSLLPVSAFADEAGLGAFAEETADGAAALGAFAGEEVPADPAAAPLHEHVWVPSVVAPTCTTQGYTLYTCACGESYVADYTDALNHAQTVDIPEVPASCTADGVSAGKQCLLCGQIVEGCQPIPAPGHVPMDVAEVPASETAPGTAAGTQCAVCGAVLSGCEVIPMLQPAAVDAQPASGDAQSAPPAQNQPADQTAQNQTDAAPSSSLSGDAAENAVGSADAEAAAAGSGALPADAEGTAGEPAETQSGAGDEAADPEAKENPDDADEADEAEQEDEAPSDESEEHGEYAFLFKPEVGENEMTSDMMLDGFMAEALYGELPPDGIGPRYAKKNFGAALTGNDARMYKELKTLITQVANGTRTSARFDIPMKTVLGKSSVSVSQAKSNGGAIFDVNIQKVWDALYYDCPYELYWHDYTRVGIYYTWKWQGSGGSVDLSRNYYTVYFDVMLEYTNGYGYSVPTSSGNKWFYTEIDTSTATRVRQAVANAKYIVSQASSLSDWDKIYYYGDAICSLVEYDHNSLGLSYYSNAHQLVNVFDGDSSTNVVCEGYAKAFQYLCDLTKFQRNIACYCLTGYGDEIADDNAHQWNAVTMDNGINYLIDITWSDGGSYMNGNIFMTMAESGSPDSGYYVRKKNSGTLVCYIYDSQCLRFLPEKARTITLNKEYVPCPILKSASNAYGGVKITWDKVEDFGVQSYYVYRSEDNGSTWTKIGSTTDSTWTDTGVRAKVKYSYRVRSVKDGVTSGFNTTKTVTYYPAPVLSGVSNVNGGVKFTWKAATGASKYRVYRKASGDTSWTHLADVSGTSYTDKSAKSGTTYRYSARSLNSSGTLISGYNTSGLSIRYIAAPALPKLSNAVGGVNITWTAVNGAEMYRVLRKTSANGEWVRVAFTSGTTFKDTSVVSNTQYIYTVRCASADGSSYTSGYNSSGKSIKYIATPTVNTVQAVTEGIQVKWNKPAGASKFRVFRKLGSGSWTKLTDTTATTITDKNVKGGTTYSYTVRCITSDGTFTSGYNTTGKSLRFAATPKAPTVALASTGVKVSWSASAGAVKYRVYRKAAGASSWSKVTDTTALSCVDTGVKSNAKYIYAVRCLTSDGKTMTSALGASSRTIHYIAAPVINNALNPESGGITLSWNKPAGAEKFRLYRKGPDDTSWVQVAYTAKTSFTDKTVEPRVVYHYAVRCVSSDGKTNKSALGPNVTCARLPVLHATSSYIEDKIRVSYYVSANDINIWCYTQEENASYALYRKDISMWSPLATGSYFDYYDSNVRAGTTYEYVVRLTSDTIVTSFGNAYSELTLRITK